MPWVVQHAGQLLVFYPRHPCDGMVACLRDVVQGMVPVPLGVVGESVWAEIRRGRPRAWVCGVNWTTSWRTDFLHCPWWQEVKAWNGPTDR